MDDIRENILLQIPIVCAGITGIAAVDQNVLDVNALYRPAIIVLDGSEEVSLARPNSTVRFSQVQMVELTPEIRLLYRADTGEETRKLGSLFRARIISAILNDATLRSLVGRNGEIRYTGCSVPEPNPEQKEPRLDLNFVFTYPLRLADLT